MERHSLSGYVHYRSVLKPKISKSAYKEIKAYADNNGAVSYTHLTLPTILRV